MKSITGLIFLILTGFVSAQNISQDESKAESIRSLLGMESARQISGLSAQSELISSINSKEYIVDSGDIFSVKIDVKGPAIKMLNVTVNPEGYVVIPDVPGIYIRDMLLADAKEKIIKILQKQFPDAQVEVFLSNIHPIKVNVLGALSQGQKITAFSTSRLFDVFSSVFAQSKLDTLNILKDDFISVRNIELRRKNELQFYDLLKFKLIGDASQNPYLRDNDIIFVPFKDSTSHHIDIKGAVAHPMQFEYRPGDDLQTAIAFAHGILPNADSSQIELIRFEKNRSHLIEWILDMHYDGKFLLQPDDRIFVRFKADYHKKYYVRIIGEVKYPGDYAIEDGISTLSEIIQQAGGFSNRASLKNAKIIRLKYLPEDRELARLQRMTVEEMNDIEESYLRLRSRENLRLVSCDFIKLFQQNIKTEDVLLRDEDIIMIPENTNIVFVSGGVFNPGNVTYQSDWNYEQYIAVAGGFNTRAREGSVRIIKNKTGIWVDADEDVVIEEGDIIFVPESKEIDWYEFFKEALTISTQVATIILIVISLK